MFSIEGFITVVYFQHALFPPETICGTENHLIAINSLDHTMGLIRALTQFNAKAHLVT